MGDVRVSFMSGPQQLEPRYSASMSKLFRVFQTTSISKVLETAGFEICHLFDLERVTETRFFSSIKCG